MSSRDGGSPPEGPTPEPGGEDESLLRRFWEADSGPLMFLREMLTSAAAVTAVGLVLFAISGVWPPMVAVESGSMQPHMAKGDLVFITEPGRFAPADDLTHGDTGIVTYRAGQAADYRTFGSYGSVIVYKTPNGFGPPIIHRARFHVEEGENWYDRANEDYVNAESCAELLNCPAPNDGFITKGDANARYDQANGIARPVKSAWVVGLARVRVPWLGWIRLGVSGIVVDASTPQAAGHASPLDVAEPSSFSTSAGEPADVASSSVDAWTPSSTSPHLTPASLADATQDPSRSVHVASVPNASRVPTPTAPGIESVGETHRVSSTA